MGGVRAAVTTTEGAVLIDEGSLLIVVDVGAGAGDGTGSDERVTEAGRKRSKSVGMGAWIASAPG